MPQESEATQELRAPTSVHMLRSCTMSLETIVMGNYEGERSDPSLAMCRGTELLFTGRVLIFEARRSVHTYSAVSGRPTPEGNFLYTTARQRQKGIGPIPAGIYWINPSEMWTNSWHSVAPRSAWGNYRITIHPFTTTETFSRGGFFIHGGDTPGSAGCIDLTNHMDDFTNDLLKELGAAQNCQIHLAVKYGEPGDYIQPRADIRVA